MTFKERLKIHIEIERENARKLKAWKEGKAATIAIRNGMPVEQVRRMLGHESLDTTLIYAKTDDSLVRMNHQRCVS